MISIIVPFKNAEKWIGRCCESLSRLEGDFDFVFVDDNSDDNGNANVWQFIDKDKRFNIFVNEGDGVSAARNTGIKYSIGEWIAFLDSDDTYSADAADSIRTAIKQYPEAGIIQLNHVRVMPDGSRRPRLTNARGIYHLRSLPKLWVSSCNKLIKRELIEDIRFIEGLSHGEDEIFILECLKKTRSLPCSERVALEYHKENPNSLSSTTRPGDLMGEQKALMYFLALNLDDSDICEAVRNRQIELWQNSTYKRVFGGV